MPVCTIQGRIARVILVYFQSPDTDAQDSNKYNLVFVRRRGLANFNDNVITNKKGEPPAKVARFLLNPRCRLDRYVIVRTGHDHQPHREKGGRGFAPAL